MTLAQTTGALRARNRKALVAFLTAGYPDAATFGAVARSAVAAGADAIEVGIPFSDPIADGPVIQAASKRALDQGTTLSGALDLAASLGRDVDVPIVVMSYINPILAMGVGRFAERAAGAGIAGVILPDVSFEESAAFRPALAGEGLAYIDLVAPTSGDARIREIASASEGFVYLVSVTGVTGSGAPGSEDLERVAGRVRAATGTPVYVGFGVSGPEQAAAIARFADGVIVGSRLLRAVAEGDAAGAAGRVGDVVASLRRALDAR